MKLAPKPFTIHPYDDMVSKGCPWLNEVKTAVLDRIKAESDRIPKESAMDGNPYLADESFLYECFVDNIEHGLVRDNWQILKYFVRMFHIKILYDVIGEWKFTDRDVEMYNHFNEIKVTEHDKCIPRYLKFHIDDDEDNLRFDYIMFPAEFYIDCGHFKYQIGLKKITNCENYHVDDKYYKPYEQQMLSAARRGFDNTGYINFFEYEGWLLQSMVQNARMEGKWKNDNFFTSKHLHTHHVHFSQDYEDFSERYWLP